MEPLKLTPDIAKKIDRIIDILKVQFKAQDAEEREKKLGELIAPSERQNFEKFIQVARQEEHGKVIFEIARARMDQRYGESHCFSALLSFAERTLSGKLPRYAPADVAKIIQVKTSGITSACKSLIDSELIEQRHEVVGRSKTTYVSTRKGYLVLKFVEKHAELLK